MDPSAARKFVLKCGLKFYRIRTSETRGQATLALTPEQLEQVITRRREAGFSTDGTAPPPIVAKPVRNIGRLFASARDSLCALGSLLDELERVL